MKALETNELMIAAQDVFTLLSLGHKSYYGE